MTRISTGDAKVDTLIALARCAHIYDRHLEKKLAKYHVNRTEYYVLDVLKENGGTMKLSELKDWLQIARHTLTLVMNSLEEKGLIERKLCSADRRSLQIYLKRKGQQCIERIIQDRQVITYKLMSTINMEETKAMNENLELLRLSLLKDAQIVS